MKRGGRLRAKSKTNSIHKQPDERLAYRDSNPMDEWNEWLGFAPLVKIAAYDYRLSMPLECNHLFTSPRRHVVPCIIMLSKINHDWFHENIAVGRMLCMVVKCRKGEADLDMWNRCYGKNVESILDEPGCLDERYAAFRSECIERLKQLKGAS